MQQNPAQFGPIPGVPLFRHFKDRRELYLAGVHGVPEGGIHGRAGTGAYSVVLSGRYTDDKDEGNVIWYTGAGGHSRTSEAQLGDQEWTRVNEALRVSEKTKQPVRVIRSSGVFSKFAPTKKGYRYDGLYQVKGAQMVIGKSGYQVCQFLLERLDGQEPIPIYGIRIHSGSSNADAAASANSSRAVIGDISAQCLPGGGMHLVPLGRPRSNPGPYTAGPSRAPVVAAPKEWSKQNRRATVGPGGIVFKYEGRDAPSGPMQRNGGVFRPPSPNPPGFR